MPTGKFTKVHCSVCHKLVDPRGIGGHMRLHKNGKKTLGEAYVQPETLAAVERANENGDHSWDVVMVPISREVIVKLVTQWMQKGQETESR